MSSYELKKQLWGQSKVFYVNINPHPLLIKEKNLMLKITMFLFDINFIV